MARATKASLVLLRLQDILRCADRQGRTYLGSKEASDKIGGGDHRFLALQIFSSLEDGFSVPRQRLVAKACPALCLVLFLSLCAPIPWEARWAGCLG